MTTPENPVGKTKTQGWEIGVRRTFKKASREKLWQQIMTELGLSPEATPDDPVYQKGMTVEAVDQTRVEIVSYVRGSLIRMRWQPVGWDFQSTLQIRVTPVKTGTTIAIHHECLQDGEQREAMHRHWSGILDKIGETLAR